MIAEELYTKKATLYRWFFIKFLRYKSGLKNFFETEQPLRQGSKVLDAGCGSGVLIKVLFSIARKRNMTGIHFYGFDLTRAMLDLFKEWIAKENAANITLKKADVLKADEQLPDDWRNYDLIISSAMLEYIPKSEIKEALRNLGSLLKPEGTFYLFITRKNFLMSMLIKRWWKANLYEKAEIKKVLQDSGFKEIRFKKFSFPYNYLNLWGFAIEAKN